MSNNIKYVFIGIGIVLIISTILLALSFEKIRYDEYAILRNNFTQKIYYEDKYKESGIYFIGIEKSFIKFPKYLIFNEFVGSSTSEDSETFSKLKVNLYLLFFIRLL